MFGDGLDSWIIFKSSRLSRVVILTNEYVNICSNISAILQIYLCSIGLIARFLMSLIRIERNLFSHAKYRSIYYYFSTQIKC